MTATIHCIRHAQGFHNLGVEYHTLTDPRLTPHGETQCLTLRQTHYPPSSLRNISLITASPLTRTLHTAYLAFQPPPHWRHHLHQYRPIHFLYHEIPPILALPDAQETSDFPCDTGSPPSLLSTYTASQSWPVDLSLLRSDWTSKGLGTRYSPASSAIASRARDVRRHLRKLARELVAQGVEKPEIVLVTHGGFLHYLTGDWEGARDGLGTGWVNCETRAYEFELGLDGGQGEAVVEGEARLVETLSSRERRGKEGAMKGWEEQAGLFVQTMEGWEGMGLQRPDRIGEEGYAWQSGLGLGREGKEEKGPGERQVESLEAEREEANKLEAWEAGRGIKVQA